MKKSVGITIKSLFKNYGIYGAIDIAKQVGADAIDFDLSGNDYRNPASIYALADHWRFIDHFKSIRRYADQKGIKICQTHGRTDPFKENDDEYKDYFCCCIDTGHINLAVKHGQPIPDEIIRKMGKRIECLHLHDNNVFVDQHRLICGGNINWAKVFKALDEIGYEGVYNTETSFNSITVSFNTETADFAVKLVKHFISIYCKEYL